MSYVDLYPSILSADFRNLEKSIHQLTNSGIGGFHVDVMDGHFVPNLTFGPWICQVMGKITRLPLDVHLMIDNAFHFSSEFFLPNVEAITVHYESNPQLHRVVQMIKGEGIKAGVSLNPATSWEAIKPIVEEVDIILVMTVNPGFGGQKFLRFVLDKISALNAFINENKLKTRIYVDGGINKTTVMDVARRGARGIIAGSSVFKDSSPAEQAELIIRNGNEAIEKGVSYESAR